MSVHEETFLIGSTPTRAANTLIRVKGFRALKNSAYYEVGNFVHRASDRLVVGFEREGVAHTADDAMHWLSTGTLPLPPAVVKRTRKVPAPVGKKAKR